MKPLSVCLLLAATAFLASCSSSNKPTASAPRPTSGRTISLEGTEWVLTDLAGTLALPGGKATLVFPEAGRVAGNGSCNRFTGALTITGDALKIGPLASTRMACVDESVSKQEDAYLKALGGATRYSYQDPDLLIYCEGFDKPLRFVRATP
ncbi:MAG TPA: META domain-containing protein [Candidatus Acidoferrales bacterium]|nr:META domain-containing protein [Candidatus Acidoferrales bacterium]